MAKRTLHFRTRAEYRKWLAFGQMHGLFRKAPGHMKIVIGGRPHKVKHKR